MARHCGKHFTHTFPHLPSEPFKGGFTLHFVETLAYRDPIEKDVPSLWPPSFMSFRAGHPILARPYN